MVHMFVVQKVSRLSRTPVDKTGLFFFKLHIQSADKTIKVHHQHNVGMILPPQPAH